MGVEDELKIKGQGDILEAGTRMFAQKMTIHNPDTNELIAVVGKANGLIRIESAKRIPVFCLFSVYDDDCTVKEDGNLIIQLSDEKKQIIREHFPNADAVVVIDNPDVFIEDIKKSIGCEIKADIVHYFNIDKGYSTDGGQIAMDMDYIRYVTQDVPPIKKNGITQYMFRDDYAYRVLFCKDVFFCNEQEYRILLPNDVIQRGTNYPVKLSTKYNLYDLEAFFCN